MNAKEVIKEAEFLGVKIKKAPWGYILGGPMGWARVYKNKDDGQYTYETDVLKSNMHFKLADALSLAVNKIKLPSLDFDLESAKLNRDDIALSLSAINRISFELDRTIQDIKSNLDTLQNNGLSNESLRKIRNRLRFILSEKLKFSLVGGRYDYEINQD